MAIEKQEKLEAQLAKLRPETRTKVEAALTQAIEGELAAEVAGVGPRAAGQFSRGWIFSRVVSKSLDDELINEALGMDEGSFTKFAERLATIKRIKDTGKL